MILFSTHPSRAGTLKQTSKLNSIRHLLKIHRLFLGNHSWSHCQRLRGCGMTSWLRDGSSGPRELGLAQHSVRLITPAETMMMVCCFDICDGILSIAWTSDQTPPGWGRCKLLIGFHSDIRYGWCPPTKTACKENLHGAGVARISRTIAVTAHNSKYGVMQPRSSGDIVRAMLTPHGFRCLRVFMDNSIDSYVPRIGRVNSSGARMQMDSLDYLIGPNT